LSGRTDKRTNGQTENSVFGDTIGWRRHFSVAVETLGRLAYNAHHFVTDRQKNDVVYCRSAANGVLVPAYLDVLLTHSFPSLNVAIPDISPSLSISKSVFYCQPHVSSQTNTCRIETKFSNN